MILHVFVRRNTKQCETFRKLRKALFKWAYAQTAALEGCLTLAPGSEAAVWDKCVGPYGVHVSPKMCGTLWCPCVT